MSRKGLFITFEGNEGCGKSTHLRLLYDQLRREGRAVLLTREPGGTRVGDAIRQVLLDGRNARMTPETETLLYMASRAQLAEEVIRPLLAKGRIVLCDRWVDATLAYQGYGAGVDRGWIRQLARAVTGRVRPDATIYLDLPVLAGLRRARRRSRLDRIESRTIRFHERVREGYLRLARLEPRRILRVAVSEREPVEAVNARIREALKAVLRRHDRGR